MGTLAVVKSERVEVGEKACRGGSARASGEEVDDEGRRTHLALLNRVRRLARCVSGCCCWRLCAADAEELEACDL